MSDEAEVAEDPYNDGYTHEVMHTVHVLQDTFYNHVFDTRTAAQFPVVKEAAEAVLDAMSILYGKLGERFSGDEEAGDDQRDG
jgi:hypothetical protein